VRTYTLAQGDLTVAKILTTHTANTAGLSELLGEGAPVQPVSVARVSGWVGAEWVRAIAHYQDAPSVGYASVEALSTDHQWTDAVNLDWQTEVAS